MTWVDPRANPKPPAPEPRWKPVEDPQEIGELLAFCRTGRIYEIERWIMAGKPLQATKYEVYRRGRLDSPLEVAIGNDLYDVVLLLLCNGYQMAAESNPYRTPLDYALERRA